MHTAKKRYTSNIFIFCGLRKTSRYLTLTSPFTGHLEKGQVWIPRSIISGWQVIAVKYLPDFIYNQVTQSSHWQWMVWVHYPRARQFTWYSWIAHWLYQMTRHNQFWGLKLGHNQIQEQNWPFLVNRLPRFFNRASVASAGVFHLPIINCWNEEDRSSSGYGAGLPIRRWWAQDLTSADGQ